MEFAKPTFFSASSSFNALLITPFVDKKFSEDGSLVDEPFQKAVDTFISEFLWLAESICKK